MTKPFNWNDFEEVKDAPEVTTESSADNPSTLEALGLGGLQGATFNLSDEIEAGARALPSLFSPEEKLLEEYYKLKSNIDQRYKQAEEAHPDAYLGGEIGGTIGSLFIPGVGLANVGARGIKAAHTAYKATKGFKPAAKALSKVVGLSAAQGAGQGALQGAGSAESGKNVEESLENTLKGAGEGAGVGATLGLGLPIAGALGSGATKEIGNLGKKGFDLIPKSDDISKAFKFGTEGKTLGNKTIKEASDSLESFVGELANFLDKTKRDASENYIGNALKNLKKSDIKGEEFVNELQKLVDQGIASKDSNIVGAMSLLSEELNKFKTITKVPDIESAKLAASKWQTKQKDLYPEIESLDPRVSSSGENVIAELKIPRDPKVSQKVIQTEIPVREALDSPESIIGKKLGQEELKTSALGKEFDYSFPKQVESIDGRQYLQTVTENIENLDPKELRQAFPILEKELLTIVDNITPENAYDLRKVIGSLMGKDKYVDSKLANIKNVVDNYIDNSLTDTGKDLLSKGKSTYSNVSDMIDSVKSMSDIATERSDNIANIRSGKFKDIKAKKDARRKISASTESGQDIRAALLSQAKNMPDQQSSEALSKIVKNIDETSELKRLSEESDIGSAMSLQGLLLGPVSAMSKKIANVAGQGQTKVSNFIQNHPKSFNLIQQIGKGASPVTRRALIQQLADQDPELKQDLESSGFDFDNYEEIDSLTSADSAPERSPSGFNDAPERSISNIEEYEKILAHLDSAEGSTNNAPSNRVMIPGKTGLYDDGKGNPTTLFGANVNSPLTRQVYAKHGIDLRKPHKYPIELHEQAATDNWSEHNNQMVRSAKNLGLDFTKIPEEKLPPVNRLLTDMVFQRGPGILKKNKSMIDALNKGDIELFKRLYVNSEHFKAGNRGITLLPWLREL